MKRYFNVANTGLGSGVGVCYEVPGDAILRVLVGHGIVVAATVQRTQNGEVWLCSYYGPSSALSLLSVR